MTINDRTAAILDANKIELFDEVQTLRAALAEIQQMAARFDTFGDPGRTRAFIGDITRIAKRAEIAR